MPEQQVPGRRRERISKLKTVAGTLLDLQNDITDPITQVPSFDTPLTLPWHSATDRLRMMPAFRNLSIAVRSAVQAQDVPIKESAETITHMLHPT